MCNCNRQPDRDHDYDQFWHYDANCPPKPCKTGCLSYPDSNCVIYAKAITCFAYPYQNYNVPLNSPLQLIIDNFSALLCELTTDIGVNWGGFNYHCLPGTILTAQNFAETISTYVCTLNTNLTTANNNIATLQAGMTNETWKNVGAGGTMANGQPVPVFSVGVSNYGNGYEVLRLRKNIIGNIDFEGTITLNLVISTIGTLYTITNLPTGYKPSAITLSDVYTTNSVTGARIPTSLLISSAGAVQLRIDQTIVPTVVAISTIRISFSTT